MKLSGTQIIAADRQTVWAAINDPEILKQCIPGCEEMVRSSPTQFEAVVKQRIGPVSATFKGAVELSNIIEGQSLRLFGEGKGGVAGMAKGGADVTLTDVEGGTQLSYDAEASVAGKLAQLGSRLIDGVARGMADKFFDNFKGIVEDGSGAGATVSHTGSTSSHISANGGSSASSSVAHTAAIAGGAAAVAGMAASSAGSAVEAVRETSVNMTTGTNRAASSMSDATDAGIDDIDMASVDGGPHEIMNEGVAAVTANVTETVRSTTEHVAGTASEASSTIMSHTADTSADLLDVDDMDIDISSVEGGPAESVVAASETVESVFTSAKDAADGIPTTTSTVTPSASVDTTEAAGEARDLSDVAKGAAVAAAGAAAAAASGFAARAGDTLDDLHETAKEKVIAAGSSIDEKAAWSEAKTHAGRAAEEAGDAVGDAVDAAKAKLRGQTDVAAREWGEARENASQAASEAGNAASDAWTAGKGLAAEEAKNPSPGPMGYPWYMWIIGVVVLILLFILFT